MITSTTLRVAVSLNDQLWPVVDASAAVVGDLAVCGAERGKVVGVLPTALMVVRGYSGTTATPHAVSSTVQYGPMADFTALFGIPPVPWVETSGESPSRQATVKIQDGADTVPIVTVTY